jgi:ABC-type Na+ efflux pump permease subunit
MLGPIFQREWLTLSRRSRHYVVRTVYLSVLWVLGLTAWQAIVGWEQTATLGETARFGLLLFRFLIFVQLVLLLFFSALSAASAITQEKDRRTFILLLLTDLRNHEIVLGKLFGSLLQIGLLLAGAVPILALNLLLGGVDIEQVLHAVVVLAATALAAGSLGGLVALWRDKTFPALALTVLFLVLYLCFVHGLSALTAVPALAQQAKQIEWWQVRLEPFLAMQNVVEPPLEVTALPPAYGLALSMLGLSVLLNGLAIARLRVWNPSGEPIIQRERPEAEEKDRARAHAAPGAVRPVWANPILWREIATRAYGRRPLLVKIAYLLAVGLICYYALKDRDRGEWQAAWGLVPLGIISLLLVSAQAVTSITTERDLGALDLLLVTDLSPREFIFGKLGGICYNTKEYLLPPLILTIVYASLGLLASPPPRHHDLLVAKNIEAALCVVGGAIVMLSFTIVLGVHVALRTENSRLAISQTLATVFFLSVGTLICIYLILINRRFESQWTSFIIFFITAIGGLWWVLSGIERPSTALTIASIICPMAVFYAVTNIIVGNPATRESADPIIPFLVTGVAFVFATAAMLVPLLSEFDVALGRTGGGGE